MRTRLSLIVFFAAASLAAAGEPKNNLGTKITDFCKANLGKQVGDGECANLASEALKEVGGQPRAKDDPNDGDYVWGKLVMTVEAGAKSKPALGDLKPGDIIQFRDAKFEWKRGKGTYTSSAPHHTAIVASVDVPNKLVKVYQQNVNGKRFVLEDDYHFGDIKEGWMRIYRAEPK